MPASTASTVSGGISPSFASAAAQRERALISARTKEGLKAAKARGTQLGGWTAGSEASKRAADELASRMKPILIELSHLPSARKIAAELNRRGITSATGGQWSSKTVVRLRERLNLGR
jgi:DNA invertase Pin-like site-specific DNA recombinase